MANGIVETQNRADAGHVQPTLTEMSVQTLEILDRNEQGFFLMIESGQIDWAAHRNDTLDAVLDWAENRQDTLIIVTADHETGGFGFSYWRRHSQTAQPAGRRICRWCFQPNFNFGNSDVLDKIFAQRLSYHDIFSQFDKLPENQQTLLKLPERVNRYTEFKITDAQAVKILATEANPFYRAGHISLGEKTFPKWKLMPHFLFTKKKIVKTCWRKLSLPVNRRFEQPESIPVRRCWFLQRGPCGLLQKSCIILSWAS